MPEGSRAVLIPSSFYPNKHTLTNTDRVILPIKPAANSAESTPDNNNNNTLIGVEGKELWFRIVLTDRVFVGGILTLLFGILALFYFIPRVSPQICEMLDIKYFCSRSKLIPLLKKSIKLNIVVTGAPTNLCLA